MLRECSLTGFELSGGCSFCRGRRATTFAGLRRLHLERIVEAVEVIEETNCAEQLNNFAFRIKTPQLGELFVAYCMGVTCHGFGQAQRSLFSQGEIVAPRPFGEVSELVLGPSQSFGKNGMASEAVGRLVH